MMFNKPSGFGGRGFGSPIPRNQPTVPFSSPSTPAPTGANGIAGAFQGINPARAGYDVGTAAIMANQQPSQVPMQGVMAGWGSQDQAPAQYMRGMMDGLRGQPPVYGGSQQNYDPYAGGQGYNPFASYNQQNAQPVGFARGGRITPPKPTNDPAANYAAAAANAARARAFRENLQAAGVLPSSAPPPVNSTTPIADTYGNLPGMMSNNPAIARAIQNETMRNQAMANAATVRATQEAQAAQAALVANSNAAITGPANTPIGNIVNSLPGMMGANPAMQQAANAEAMRNQAMANAQRASNLLASGAIVNTPYGYMSMEEATRRGINPDQMAERTRLGNINMSRHLAEMDARTAELMAARAANPPAADTDDENGKNVASRVPIRPSPFSDLTPPRPHTSHFAPSATPAPAASVPPSVAATPSSEPQGAQNPSSFTGFQNMRDNFRNQMRTYQPAQTTPSRPQAGAFGGFGNAAGGGRSPVAGGILGGRR